MEIDSKQQIEEELRRVLNLKQDQPSLNTSRQSEGSHCVSSSTSLPSGDVQSTYLGSPSLASSPLSPANAASPVGAAEKIPTVSSSLPSINHLKQASSVNEASKRRKSRQSKQNSPRYVPHEAKGVTGSFENGQNVSGSQKSAFAVKPENPRIDVLEVASTKSANNNNASSTMCAGLSTSGSSLSMVTGMHSSTDERTSVKALTDQGGGKASRGRGRASKKRTNVSTSTVPGRSLEKPKNVDNVQDVCASHVPVSLSEELSSTASNTTGNVKFELLPTADEHMTKLPNAPATKITESVQQPVKKHEKGIVCIH